MREKAWSTLLVTIHRRPENLHVGMPLMQRWLSKTPYTLCRSCRGVLDPQICYLPHGALQLKKFEKISIKVGQSERFFLLAFHSAPSRRRRASPTPGDSLGLDAETGYHPLVRAPGDRPC
jgi:hypothetical protein